MTELLGHGDIEHQRNNAQIGDRSAVAELYASHRVPSIAEICASLRELQSSRRFSIRMQSKCDRGVEAYIARKLGYHADLDKAEREKLFSAAGKLRKQVESGGDDRDRGEHQLNSVIAAVAPLVLVTASSRQGFDELRDGTEKEMRRLARLLPVWTWAKAVSGLSDLGLAVIVGEAGDLSAYRKVPGKPGSGVAKLWKRLGLAVIGDVRQGGLQRSAAASEWIVHGYNRERRAEIWVIGDVVLRQQWRGDRDEDGGKPKKTGKPVAVPAHSIGPYGDVYGEKKAEYLDREWDAGHADAAARRYMTKRIIRHLWYAWRDFSDD